MSKKQKTKWNVLKKTLKLEVQLTKKAMKNSKKDNFFKECIECESALDVFSWILSEMRDLEELFENIDYKGVE